MALPQWASKTTCQPVCFLFHFRWGLCHEIVIAEFLTLKSTQLCRLTVARARSFNMFALDTCPLWIK